MPVKTFRPLTPSTRYITIASYDEITKTKPEKSLIETRKKSGGRNHYGRMTARGIGGGHKQDEGDQYFLCEYSSDQPRKTSHDSDP